jgi:hypothetical protein
MWRPCGNFWCLNMVTVADRILSRTCWTSLARQLGALFKKKIDLRKGYHQISVHPADIQKMAITTPFGSSEYLQMPFGLMNTGPTFQRKVDRAVVDLEAVFTRLREHGLVINVEKCVFRASSIQFLGHLLSAEGVELLPESVSAVTDFPRWSTVKELQMFLGMVNFYRRFLPGAARALKPLTDCLRGGPKGPTAVE